MKLIDKDAVLAEIEKRQNVLDIDNPLGFGGMVELEYLKDNLNFLEVKEVEEVDFEKEYAKFSNDIDAEYAFPIDLADYKDFAKHFFELGLKAQKGKKV